MIMMMMMMIMMTILLILNLTYIGNSDWQREFSPYTKSCEVDRITRYLQHILHLSTPVQSLPGFQAP